MARLHALRWRLTVLFTVMNTVGLVVFAWLVLAVDSARGEEKLDAELRPVTSAVLRLVDYDGSIGFSRVSADELDKGCPRFFILPGGAKAFGGHRSQGRCVDVELKTVSDLARQSVSTGRPVNGYQRGPDGRLLRLAAEPFREPGGDYAGAVVAVTDAEHEMDRHRRVVLLVLGACVVLVAGVAVGGYALAGRATRPAAAALERQEELLADAAHDLRTPIAALRALAETAAGDPAQRADLLPRTVGLAARMGEIIDGLLLRAKLAAGVEQLAIQPFMLDQMVGAVVEETPAGDASVNLVAAPTMVEADPTLVHRAVRNLLDNALRHGRTPGQQAVVTITVANGRVTVADRGPGIDPARAEEMFDRYSSGAGSSGLGLSIVRWVAQAHGGTLNVYNADEGGAIFEFTLPVSQAGQ